MAQDGRSRYTGHEDHGSKQMRLEPCPACRPTKIISYYSDITKPEFFPPRTGMIVCRAQSRSKHEDRA